MRLILTLCLLSLACGSAPIIPPAAPLLGTPWNATEAAHEAAAYLIRHLDADGRFDYVRRSPVSEKKYNILRHAGSIHALVQYHDRHPSAASQNAILRASRYLKARYVHPLPKHPELLATISRPGEENLREPTAKLGGTALTLIALCGAFALDPTIVNKNELAALGNFLLFMQKEDGSFHSKYIVDQDFDPSFHSLYYPGETMLALTMLYDIDKDQRWLHAALRSAAQLVESRQSITDWPADHWMMLASAPLLERYDKVEAPALSATTLRKHITVMAKKITKKQRRDGHFGKKPRSTPTATRLEGLAALAQIQARNEGTIAPGLHASIQSGLHFLMACQLREHGKERGGIPRSCASDVSEQHRDHEIRVDYVQHYLSALLTAPR